MDVFSIDKTFYYPDKMVEGWTSMVWTERHTALCDFQMKTPYVDETMAKLPLKSLIGIRGSSEVMMVETFQIGEDDKGAPELTVTGRSLEAFLANRVLTGPYQEPWEAPGQYTVQDAILMYIWNSIVNPTSEEVIRDYHWDHLARDVIPNVVVSDSTKVLKAVVGSGTPEDLQTVKYWGFETGNLYSKVQEMLTIGNLGIRIIRPNSTAAKILTNVTYTAGNYTMQRTLTKAVSDTTKLRFDIYNGRNRTMTSATDTPLDINTPIILSKQAGHFTSPSTLLSVADLKTCIHLQSSDQTVEIYAGETGLNHYMDWQDDGPVDTSVDFNEHLRLMSDKLRAEYKRRATKRLLDGEVTASSPYQYGTDFYLGDLVTVKGTYGVDQTMQVSEFIRSADKSGEKAYPTLIVPQ